MTLSILPKNTTQCPLPGLKPGPLDPRMSTLSMRPQCFYIRHFGHLSSSKNFVYPWQVLVNFCLICWKTTCQGLIPPQPSENELKLLAQQKNLLVLDNRMAIFSNPDHSCTFLLLNVVYTYLIFFFLHVCKVLVECEQIKFTRITSVTDIIHT